jgi:hypothetical protein
MKRETAIHGPLLVHKFDQWETTVTNSWWSSIWHFCSELNLTVHDKCTTDLPVQRKGDQGRLTCPRQAYLDNLAQLVQQWHTENNVLVLMMDANEDTEGESFKQWYLTLNLHNPLAAYGQIPSTTIRGSKAIDTILVSTALAAVTKAGLTDWSNTCGTDGHRAIWLEIPTEVLFSGRITIPTPTIRRLQVKDPRASKAFVSEVHKIYANYGTPQAVHQLAMIPAGNRTDTHTQEWEIIDNIRIQAISTGGKGLSTNKSGTGTLDSGVTTGRPHIRLLEKSSSTANAI